MIREHYLFIFAAAWTTASADERKEDSVPRCEGCTDVTPMTGAATAVVERYSRKTKASRVPANRSAGGYSTTGMSAQMPGKILSPREKLCRRAHERCCPARFVLPPSWRLDGLAREERIPRPLPGVALSCRPVRALCRRKQRTPRR